MTRLSRVYRVTIVFAAQTVSFSTCTWRRTDLDQWTPGLVRIGSISAGVNSITDPNLGSGDAELTIAAGAPCYTVDGAQGDHTGYRRAIDFFSVYNLLGATAVVEMAYRERPDDDPIELFRGRVYAVDGATDEAIAFRVRSGEQLVSTPATSYLNLEVYPNPRNPEESLIVPVIGGDFQASYDEELRFYGLTMDAAEQTELEELAPLSTGSVAVVARDEGALSESAVLVVNSYRISSSGPTPLCGVVLPGGGGGTRFGLLASTSPSDITDAGDAEITLPSSFDDRGLRVPYRVPPSMRNIKNRNESTGTVAHHEVVRAWKSWWEINDPSLNTYAWISDDATNSLYVHEDFMLPSVPGVTLGYLQSDAGESFVILVVSAIGLGETPPTTFTMELTLRANGGPEYTFGSGYFGSMDCGDGLLHFRPVDLDSATVFTGRIAAGEFEDIIVDPNGMRLRCLTTDVEFRVHRFELSLLFNAVAMGGREGDSLSARHPVLFMGRTTIGGSEPAYNIRGLALELANQLDPDVSASDFASSGHGDWNQVVDDLNASVSDNTEASTAATYRFFSRSRTILRDVISTLAENAGVLVWAEMGLFRARMIVADLAPDLDSDGNDLTLRRRDILRGSLHLSSELEDVYTEVRVRYDPSPVDGAMRRELFISAEGSRSWNGGTDATREAVAASMEGQRGVVRRTLELDLPCVVDGRVAWDLCVRRFDLECAWRPTLEVTVSEPWAAELRPGVAKVFETAADLDDDRPYTGGDAAATSGSWGGRRWIVERVQPLPEGGADVTARLNGVAS
jgi:hypothetical protein